MALQLITPAVKLPLSLDEIKSHLRIHSSVTVDDALLMAMQRAALSHAEETLASGRAFITQTWREYWDGFPHWSPLLLSKAKVQSVTSVKYIDTAGVQQTWSASLYDTDLISSERQRARIEPAFGEVWPSTRHVMNAVEVEYVAGWGIDWNSVPEDARLGLLGLTGHLYENRETYYTQSFTFKEVPAGYAAMLTQYRVNYWT